ncbi:MAG: M48 family metallopeptidase [Planctomycetes bacterium]|nr:M48 family metallopeptidase [Planctomycetota bacterium]
MNAYGFSILGAILFQEGLSLAADLLNLRALRPELPAGFEHVYDAERYARSQEYTRARTRFSFLPQALDLALLLGFWFAGGFAWLDGWARGLGLGPIATGLVFIGALGLGKGVIDLPFRYYSTFVIEERFGFNKSTRRTFWADTLKGLGLALVLGAPLLAAILLFFERMGPSAWLWCWGATALFTLFVQFIAPTWIFPLFNKFEALQEGELRAAVLDYARKVGFPLEGLFVIDGSRRSTKANAFFTGFGKRKRVALFDTLIARHPPAELVAVVAHEIGHYKRGHIKQGLALGILQAGVVFYLLSLFLGQAGLFRAFGVEQASVHAGLVFFSLLYTPLALLLSLGMQAFSRRNEFEADAFARATTGDSERLARALERIAADSLSNLTPHPLYVALHHSHPPLVERLRALRRLAP